MSIAETEKSSKSDALGFEAKHGQLLTEDLTAAEDRDEYLAENIFWVPIEAPWSTQIPACLWFLARNKNPGGKFRDRRGQILFIDARKQGVLVDRTRRELTNEEIARIGLTYHAWRGEPDSGAYEDIPGFCKSADLDLVRSHGHVLTPGRYVGAQAIEDDGIDFTEKMNGLTTKLREQIHESRRLDDQILSNLEKLGFHGLQ